MTITESPEIPVREPRVWPLSVPAYRALGELGLIPEKTELLYGRVFHKMPKSPLHRLLFMRLLQALQNAVPQGCHVQPEQPVTCGDSEPEPDLSVIRGSMNDYGTDHPHTAELVIEVCVTSHEYDRSKLRAYARAGVKECWLVLGPEKQIEAHRHPAGEGFSERDTHGPGGRLASTAVPQFTVRRCRSSLWTWTRSSRRDSNDGIESDAFSVVRTVLADRGHSCRKDSISTGANK